MSPNSSKHTADAFERLESKIKADQRLSESPETPLIKQSSPIG
jgi:hypothetical protein